MDPAAFNFGSPPQGRTKGISWLGFLSLFLYLSGFLVWLTPLPILYVYKKKGRELGSLTLGLVLFVLLVLYLGVIPTVASSYGTAAVAKYFFWVPGVGAPEDSGINSTTFGIAYFLFYGAIGIMLGEWEPKIQDVTLLVGRVSGVLILFLFILIFWKVGANWEELVSGLENYILKVLDSMTMVAQGGSEMQQQLAFLDSYRETIAYYTVRLLPGVVINSIIFITWLNIIASKKLFVKEGMFPKLGPLKNWRLPFFSVWLVIGTALLLLCDAYWLHVNYFKIIAINAFLVFGLVYFFQGLSIAAFFIQRWSLSPIIKLIFYVLFIIFFQPIGILLLAFGFFDSWFDFRKLTRV